MQNSRHPDYTKRYQQWIKCRDSVNGQTAIKEKRTTYLRAPSGMPDYYAGTLQYTDSTPSVYSNIAENDYDTYLDFADWFGAAERTVEGFLGLIFRKPVEIEMPEEWRARVDPHLSDITNTGLPLDAFCAEVMKQMLTTSRVGIMVDQPDSRTPADQRRPHWKSVPAESIINWDRTDRLGLPILTRVILEEERIMPKKDDPYEKEVSTIWQELVITEMPVVNVGNQSVTAPRYAVVTWTKNQSENGAEEFVLESRVVPTRFEAPLSFIPFVMINANDLDVTPPKPDLLALAEKCISYYQTSAALKWSLHWTMLKTLFVVGPDLGTDPIRLGGTAVQNIATRENTQVILVEPGGAQSDALREQLEAVKAEMAVLGSRLLSNQQAARGVEAAETVAWRHMGEQSILQSRVNMVSMGVTKALRKHCYWMGLTEDPDDERVSVQINTDFLPVGLTPQMLMSLVTSLQSGTMTAQDVHHQLSQGEMLAPEHIGDFETWQARRELEADELLTNEFTNGGIGERQNTERDDESADTDRETRSESAQTDQ